jgi:AcrR family transcriptional regulator
MSRLEQRQRPGGRSEDVRRRVATACLALLAEGDVDLGPVEVSRRAGVSRATLHRWWPTRTDLLREALTEHTRPLAAGPDTGRWADDVHRFARTLAAFFADPVEVGLNVLMASGRHGDITAAVLDLYDPIFDGWRAMVARARARGEIADGVDDDAVLLALVSPLVLQPLLFRRTMPTREVRALADLVVRAST